MTRILASASLIGLIATTVSTKPTHAETPIVETADVQYTTGDQHPDGRDLVDIYMPDGAQDAPVIVYFHGGALRAGDKADGKGFARRVVPSGIGVVVANYRLTPSVQHPVHAQDAAEAVAWVAKNIQRYGGDPQKLYLSGHSAGAYLAVLLSIDPSYLSKHGLGPKTISGTIAISPFLYVEETAKDRPKDVWGDDPARWLEASVTPHIGAGKNPMLLIYADGDEQWRRNQNERFAAALRDAGDNDVTVQQTPNRNHVTIIRNVLDEDDEIGGAVEKFLK